MLKFVENGDKLVNDELEKDDSFAVVGYNGYTRRPTSLRVYTVEKALTRDIVCVGKGIPELRLKRSRTESNCYALTDPALIEIRDIIRLQNRRNKAERTLKNFEISEHGDAELLAAIEAFQLRMEQVVQS